MKLNPASTKRSRSEKDVASSTVHPNTLPPKHNGETLSSLRPSFLNSMDPIPFLRARIAGDPPGYDFRRRRPREPISAHAKRIHIELQHGFFFLTFMVFFFTQTNNGPHDLAVKPRTLQFRVNFLDIVADGLFFFFQALDALDESAQLADSNRLGFAGNVVAHEEFSNSKSMMVRMRIAREPLIESLDRFSRESQAKLRAFFDARAGLTGQALWIAGKASPDSPVIQCDRRAIRNAGQCGCLEAY
jgi:hypothetical protein